MAMNKRPFEWKRDGVGLALFVAGAFVSTLMVMALRADQPLDQIAGSCDEACEMIESAPLPEGMRREYVALVRERTAVLASGTHEGAERRCTI